MVSPKPGKRLVGRLSPSCYSFTRIFKDNSFNNDALCLLGITRLHLVPVVMSSVPLKRLYRELPVWIVEDHHDVSLAHWRDLTPCCRLFLIKRRLTKRKTCQLCLEAHRPHVYFHVQGNIVGRLRLPGSGIRSEPLNLKYVHVTSFPQLEHLFHTFLIFRSPKTYISNSDVIVLCRILCLRICFSLHYV